MDKYSRLEPFDPENDDWVSYQERLELAFMLNKVEDSDGDESRAALLSVCGKKSLLTAKEIVCPEKACGEVVSRTL